METFTAKVATKAILEAIKDILTLLTGSESNHSMESSGFFCHSDFYLKSISKVVEIQNCRFYNLFASEYLIWVKFQPLKCVEMNKIQNSVSLKVLKWQISNFYNAQKLISRKKSE